MSLDCNRTKERLEALIDQIVDAGLKSQEIEPSKVSQLFLSAECQQHLNLCSDCRNYQAANRMLIEAAAVLPMQAVPQADLLTASIMQAVMDEPMTAVIKTKAEIKSKSYGEIYLVALSFMAFAAASTYGVQLDESLWNIGSWLIAIIVFVALKPLLEQQPLSQKQVG